MLINAAVLAGEELELIEEAHLHIDGGRIQEVCDGYAAGGLDLRNCLAVPGLVNAHTHVGDSFAKEAAAGLSVKEAVGKTGKKWALYEKSSRRERVAAMEESLVFMLASGTTCFVDFREFGAGGVEELEEALDEVPLKAVILGRDMPADEVDGLGLNLYQAAQVPKKRGKKIVALHAGEARGEVKAALKHSPDVIVHATLASDADLKTIAKKKISVVVCPRSNAAFGVGVPPVARMLELGINVALGTDNVMVNSPNMWREMEYAAKACGLSAADVLRMASVNGALAFGLDSGVIKEGRKADILFIRTDAPNLRRSADILSSVVNRCEPENLRMIVVDGRVVCERR